ncbi:MAG: LON peptidase substrate-binding domain-containing protein [Pseudomonadota bacterium]
MARRFSPADLPEVVPVFPLPGALLLPRGLLPLNIFEPRYLAMLDDALKSEHRLIGMIQPMERKETPPRLHQVGCAGRVTSLSETEDGRYLIALNGVCRFRVAGELDGFTPYRRVTANWRDFHGDLGAEEEDDALQRDTFFALLKRFFDSRELSSDWDSLKSAETELLINSLSMMCPFSPEEKQALLEAPKLADRRETLIALMEFSIASGSGDSGAIQ